MFLHKLNTESGVFDLYIENVVVWSTVDGDTGLPWNRVVLVDLRIVWFNFKPSQPNRGRFTATFGVARSLDWAFPKTFETSCLPADGYQQLGSWFQQHHVEVLKWAQRCPSVRPQVR